MTAGLPPIYLAFDRGGPGRVARWVKTHDGSPVRWLYLGRNSLAMRRWEDAMGAGFERVSYARTLQEVAHRLRRPFLEWTAALGHGHDPLLWWTSRLAERNTYVSPLFRELCYLRIAVDGAGAARGPLLIVSDSLALLRQIAVQPALRDRVRWCVRAPRLRERGGWLVRMAIVWPRALWRLGRIRRAARLTGRGMAPPPRDGRPRLLLHAWLDDEAFREDGTVKDRYFTVLPEELRRRGWEVIVLPLIHDLRRSPREVFRVFRRSPDRFLVLEDHTGWRDDLWSAWFVIRHVRLGRGRHRLDGLDVTDLVHAAARRGAADADLARFVRYIRLFRRLAAAGFSFDVYLDKFDNMVTEKPQVLALRELWPQVWAVGYQHYFAPYSLQLHMFTTPAEAASAPHPDLIVCHSAFCADLFAREGFPAAKLRVGPSLRYLHLFRPPEGDAGYEQKTVLVLLPLDTVAAAEMANILGQAFPDARGIRFLLKVHPMMEERDWRIVSRDLPAHVTRVAGEMGDLLPGVAAAILPSGTTTSGELLLRGVPFVLLGRETDLDLDPLAWFPEAPRPVHAPEELRRAVDTLLGDLATARAAARGWADQWRERCVTPLTDETVAAFVTPPERS